MQLSIIIATRNRAHSLSSVLTNVSKQTATCPECELIVVDNGSSDATQQLVTQCTNEQILYCYEPNPGLSRARNTGWRTARGRYIAFLDDDAVPADSWLRALLHACAQQPDDNFCLGGRTKVTLPCAKPTWLSDKLLLYLGELDCGSQSKTLSTPPHYALGCNMLLPRRVLEAYDGFATNLGRTPTQLRSGEEVLLQKQLVASGGRIEYVSDALAYHQTARERLSRRWFLQRRFWEGISCVATEVGMGETISLWHEYYRLLRSLASVRLYLSFSVTRWCDVCENLGRVIGVMRAARVK